MVLLNPPPIQTPEPVILRTEVIDRLDRFAALADEWEALMIRADVCHMNLSHPWLMAWLRQFPPRRLFVVLVRDELGQLTGAAPLMIHRPPQGAGMRLLRRVQFIGTRPTVYDWMHVLARGNEEPVMRAVAQCLQAHQDEWDMLDLQFCNRPGQLEILSSTLGRQLFKSTVVQTMACPYRPLQGDLSEYLLSRGKRLRRDMQKLNGKIQRELGSDPLKLEAVPPGEAGEALLDALFDNHIRYWDERGVVSDFKRYPSLRDFYRDIHHSTQSARSRMDFTVLRAGETTLAYQIGFKNGRQYVGNLISYVGEYRRFRPGILLTEAQLSSAVEAGFTCYNFGRGDVEYKLLWTEEKFPLFSLAGFAHPAAWFLWQLDHGLKKLLGKA